MSIVNVNAGGVAPAYSPTAPRRLAPRGRHWTCRGICP